MDTFLEGKCSAELSKALLACEMNNIKELTLLLKEMVWVDGDAKWFVFNSIGRCIRIDDHLCFELLFLFVVERTKTSVDSVIVNQNLLTRTMTSKSKKCFEYLISVSFDINLTGSIAGMTSLQIACKNNSEMAVELLLKYGADVNKANFWNENAVHTLIDWYDDVFAVGNPPRRILQMLLMAGIDTFRKDYRGFMPGENGVAYQSRTIGKAARSHTENCY